MSESLNYSAQHRATGHLGNGIFVVFEGGDGAGKSTQVKLLERRLRQENYDVICTREPGGTAIGEKLRQLVLENAETTIDARTEALIFAASRAAHAQQLIRPALAEGKIVLCDRYIDSSAVYQGVGRELGQENITNLSLWATENLHPDITFLLNLPLEKSRQRTHRRGQQDRLEAEPDSFHQKIQQAFNDLPQSASAKTHHYVCIDAQEDIEQIHQNIYAHLIQYIQEQG
ncbi:dTMP kinase [Rothia sp. P6271]|uniref:dTMP kinase n=1 Tax=Rothia sp. P6271 TaxID=3402659 RepID=UPI003AC135E5